MKNLTLQEALKKIEELKDYVSQLEREQEFIKIDYSVIPKEIFDKYGVKPFLIAKKKLRNDKGEVWNNLNYFDAQKEVKKLGCRLPTIQEMLVLLEWYKKKKGDNASIHDKEFLGIKELGYDENVCLEWIYMTDKLGFFGGAFALYLDWTVSLQSSYGVGLRCAR